MKRSTWEGRSIVWRYGCPHDTVLDDGAMAQLRLAHELRNELVAIWHRHQDLTAAAWSTMPQVAVAAEAVTTASGLLGAATEELADARKNGRSRRAGLDERAAVASARAVLRVTRAAHRDAKAAAYDILAPTFHTLNAAVQAARKATYAEFVQSRGLFWATYNDVAAHHATAIATVRSARLAGQSSTLRFARWTGEGTITVQLQREADQPMRSPAVLTSSDSPWRNFFSLGWISPEAWSIMTPPQRRLARLMEIGLRIGALPDRSPLWVVVPVIAHRPLPVEAEITVVRLTRRRVAGHFRHSVAISFRLPRPPARTGATVAVNTGWRTTDDGSLRVAVWSSRGVPEGAFAPQVPAGWVRADTTGRSGELRLPARWLDAMADVDKLRSRRDTKLDALRAAVVENLGRDPSLAAAWELTPDDVARWRSPGRFAALAIAHRDEVGDLCRALEAWRRQDRHVWEREANERDQLVAQRNDVYRVVAAALATAFAEIVTSAPFAARVTRRPSADLIDDEQAERARAYARRAAQAIFTSALADAFAARGGRYVAIAAPGSTGTHHGCGATLAPGDAARAVMVVCPGCGARFDHDLNNTYNLLDRAVEV